MKWSSGGPVEGGARGYEGHIEIPIHTFFPLFTSLISSTQVTPVDSQAYLRDGADLSPECGFLLATRMIPLSGAMQRQTQCNRLAKFLIWVRMLQMSLV